MKHNILGVITARGGSKGIPRKNIIKINGKPLIQYTIDEALKSHHLTKTIVSTEDEEIANIARDLGAEVPFMRPRKLAEDHVLSIDVVKHALLEMEKIDKIKYNIIILLQPTSPFRKSEDIDNGIDLLLRGRTDSVVGVVRVGGHHPLRMKRVVNDGWLVNYIDQGFEDMRPRQILPPVYRRNGTLYISWRNIVMGGTMVGENCKAYIMPPERSLDIDTKFDLIIAEHMIKEENERK